LLKGADMSFRPRSFFLASAAVLLACGAPDNDAESAPASVEESVKASPTFIVTATAYLDEKGNAGAMTTLGFQDSSFQYGTKGTDPNRSKTICFYGNVNEVCGQIRSAAAAMRREYTRGAHDDIDLKSCEVKMDDGMRFVRARYHLSDDYGGGLDVERHIDPCPYAR
jgi:hypothetical protein